MEEAADLLRQGHGDLEPLELGAEGGAPDVPDIPLQFTNALKKSEAYFVTEFQNSKWRST